jgi:hypothetical protein
MYAIQAVAPKARAFIATLRHLLTLDQNAHSSLTSILSKAMMWRTIQSYPQNPLFFLRSFAASLRSTILHETQAVHPSSHL